MSYFQYTKAPVKTHRVILWRNVDFQEYERRKLKKARDIQKLSKASTSDELEGEGRTYRDEDRFEVQDDSNPVISTLTPSIVEKGKMAFSKLRLEWKSKSETILYETSDKYTYCFDYKITYPVLKVIT